MAMIAASVSVCSSLAVACAYCPLTENDVVSTCTRLHFHAKGLFQNNTDSRDYQIEQQRKILVLQYNWNNEVIFEYFEDFGESGTLGIGERVGVTRLLEDIQSGFIKVVYVFLVDRLFRDKLLENVIRFAKACYEKRIIIITSCYIYRMWIAEDYEKFIDDCKLAWKALDLQLNKRMLPMRVFASHSGKYDSRTLNIGYTVDRDKHSQTYKKYVALPKHGDIVKEKIFLHLSFLQRHLAHTTF
jgi:Resolvase, N terminal domain